MDPAVGERLARIETKLDTILDRGQDLEYRMRSLEKERWLHRGVAAGLTTLIGVLLSKFGISNLSH